VRAAPLPLAGAEPDGAGAEPEFELDGAAATLLVPVAAGPLLDAPAGADAEGPEADAPPAAGVETPAGTDAPEAPADALAPAAGVEAPAALAPTSVGAGTAAAASTSVPLPQPMGLPAVEPAESGCVACAGGVELPSAPAMRKRDVQVVPPAAGTYTEVNWRK
jgi:hypothetical protein